jgi:hypothetical protein
MKNASIFHGQLEYFTVLWYILWPFGNVVVIRYIFPRFGILCQDKNSDFYASNLFAATRLGLSTLMRFGATENYLLGKLEKSAPARNELLMS